MPTYKRSIMKTLEMITLFTWFQNGNINKRYVNLVNMLFVLQNRVLILFPFKSKESYFKVFFGITYL